MLADEGFALHFLEDTFAAGHVAGTWGDVSQRKGTHDHYNESGLEVFTWGGGSVSAVLMGDAHMRGEDTERAAGAVRDSLAQVIDQASGRPGVALLPHTPGAPAEPDAFDVCKNNVLVRRDEGVRVTAEGRDAARAGAAPDPGAGPRPGARLDAALSRRSRAVRRFHRGRRPARPSTAAICRRSRRTAASPAASWRCAPASASTA